MNQEEAIRQFLGDRPEAAQLREWCAALEHRLEGMRRERAAHPAAGALDAQIAQIERHLAALREEKAVTEFVEDSVRVTLAMGTIQDGIAEYEE